ncbi:MAG TPA: hypothetical protein VGX68_17810 [Thermoanaerobaculia bacterium]|jgi:uncharacterized protein YggE|nr:hypothetical protein [Thermoanaerobaculia bacterium]
MRKISLMILVAAAVFAGSAMAQEPVCNEERAEGIARSELGSCIAAPTGAAIEVEVTACSSTAITM